MAPASEGAMKLGSLNPAAQFEYDLQRVIRRATRSTEHHSTIKEFASHFADIYEEETALGLDSAEAERKARARMGNLYSIAFQILNTPERAKKGIRIQQLALSSFLLMIALYLGSVMATDDPGWLQILPKIVQFSEVVFVVGGIVFGFGILLAKRIVWKPVALATLFVFLVGGFAINEGVQPSRYMHVTLEEAKDLVAKQKLVEPEVMKYELQVMVIQQKQGRKPDVFAKELAPLTRLAQSNPSRYYRVQAGNTGSYLYPLSIEYPKDKTYSYLVTLKATNDIAVAKKQWSRMQTINGEIMTAIWARTNNFHSYQNFLTMKPASWTLGFNLSGILAIGCTGAFLMLAAAGYMIGRIRVLGLDWFRLSRV